jgi:hypothetical protein
MKKCYFVLILAVLHLILMGCAATRSSDFSGRAVPDDDFFNRKVAIDYPVYQKYTQCSLNEFIKGMEPGKWMKVSDAQWLYNMKNNKFNIYVLFIKHPLRKDTVMFQRVVINDVNVSEEGLFTLFNFTLSETDRNVINSGDVSTDGVFTLFNTASAEKENMPAGNKINRMPQNAPAEVPVSVAEAPKTPLVTRQTTEKQTTEPNSEAPVASAEAPEVTSKTKELSKVPTVPTMKPGGNSTDVKQETALNSTETKTSSFVLDKPVQAAPMQEMPGEEIQKTATTMSATTAALQTKDLAEKMPSAAKETPPSALLKIKVIGNRDSKRYHLPGMKYYKAVKAYHRVEFESEADAIKAGYHKAPR